MVSQILTEKRGPGRPRSLTFDEMVAKQMVSPLGANYKQKINEGGPQLNIRCNATENLNLLTNNLRSLKRLARQMRVDYK